MPLGELRAPAVVAGAGEADVGRCPQARPHGRGRIVAFRHGVHLHLGVLGEGVADPAGAQLGCEHVLGPVHHDHVEGVDETTRAFDEVLVAAMERCEPSSRHATRLGARHGRNDARCTGDPPPRTGFQSGGVFGGLESPAVWLSGGSSRVCGNRGADDQTCGDPGLAQRAEPAQGLRGSGSRLSKGFQPDLRAGIHSRSLRALRARTRLLKPVLRHHARRERPARHRGRRGRLRARRSPSSRARRSGCDRVQAREAGGSFAASAGSSRVLRFEYGPDAHYTELSCVPGSSGGSSSACSARRCTRRPACSGSRSRSRATSGTPSRRAWPPAFRCGCSSPPRPCGSSPHSRPKASRSCCTTRRAGSARAPRDARPGPAGPRRGSGPARGRGGARDRRRIVELAEGRERAGRSGARGHRRWTAGSCRPRRPLHPAGQRLPARCRRPDCRSGSTTSTSTAWATTAERPQGGRARHRSRRGPDDRGAQAPAAEVQRLADAARRRLPPALARR